MCRSRRSLRSGRSRDGLAVLVPEQSPIKSFDDLRGKKIATGRGSIGHQLILAALEARGWKPDDVKIVFLAPSDAKVAYTQGSVDAWSTWEPYVSQEEVLFKSRRVITGEGLTPGLGFQVATPNAITDKRPNSRISCVVWRPRAHGRRTNVSSYAETWGKLMSIPPVGAAQLADAGRKSGSRRSMTLSSRTSRRPSISISARD